MPRILLLSFLAAAFLALGGCVPPPGSAWDDGYYGNEYNVNINRNYHRPPPHRHDYHRPSPPRHGGYNKPHNRSHNNGRRNDSRRHGRH